MIQLLDQQGTALKSSTLLARRWLIHDQSSLLQRKNDSLIFANDPQCVHTRRHRHQQKANREQVEDKLLF